MPSSTLSGQTAKLRYVVHIIESPHDVELLDGRQDREPLRHVLKQAGIDAREYVAVNAKCFGQALITIAKTHEPGTQPIIHVSAHGDKTGIELTSGECLTWTNLRGVFNMLNTALDSGLLLGMSVCEGLHALKMVANSTDAPFHTLVGPTMSIDWRDSLVAFVAIYHLVITRNLEPQAAEAAMNAAAGLAPQTFRVVTSAQARKFHEKRMMAEAQKLFAEAAKLLVNQQQNVPK